MKFISRAALAAVLPIYPAAAQTAPAGPIGQGAPTVSASEKDAVAAADAAPAAHQATRGEGNIVITGRRLDAARDSITPSLGASQYTFDREALNKQPGGTNLTLNKSLLQAPGVTQDSYGVIHVRNEHANLQYRINGIMLPDGVGAFGQIIDTGIVGSLALITGALPAQYGPNPG